MQCTMRIVLLVVVLCLLCGQGQSSGSSYSKGKTKTYAGGSTFSTSSTGTGSATVRTTSIVRSSSDGGTKTEKTTTSSSGYNRGGKKSQKVKVQEGEVMSTSRVSGRGTVIASASASASPTKSSGTSSTTVGGKTRTVKKTKFKGKPTKTKKTEFMGYRKIESKTQIPESLSQKPEMKKPVESEQPKQFGRTTEKTKGKKGTTIRVRSESHSSVGGRAKIGTKVETKSSSTAKSRGGKTTKGVKQSSASFDRSRSHTLPICKGLSKFECCDDRTFKRIKGRTYCGCWGADKDPMLCSYEVVTKKPLLVVRDIFADFSGESCRCPKLSEEKIKKCEGDVKRDCCGRHGSKATCQCSSISGRCLYKRISKSPLVWKHTRLSSFKCQC